MIQSIHFAQRVGLALLIAVASVASCVGAESVVAPALQFPEIETYGGFVDLPSAEERPRAGGRVVFDTTAAGPAGTRHDSRNTK
jgi:hypothetical protein